MPLDKKEGGVVEVLGRYLLKSVTLMPPLHTYPHLAARSPAEEADWTDAAPQHLLPKVEEKPGNHS